MNKRRAWRIAGLILLPTVMGVVGYHCLVVRPRERALALLRERVRIWGGRVGPDQPFNRNLARLRPWIGNDLARWLGGDLGMIVGVNGNEGTKEQLAELLTAPRIRRVILSGCSNLDDDALARIDPTSSMIQFCASETGITDRSIPKILEMQGLVSLELVETAISDSGVDRLRKLPNLRGLWVGGPNIKAIRLVDAGVFDSSGRPATQAHPNLVARGTVKTSGLDRELKAVRVMIRDPGQWPPWRSTPYGWDASILVEGNLIREATDSWSFNVVLPAIPAGKLSVDVWVEEPMGSRKALFYSLEPFKLELAPLAKATESK